jgi:HAMP domain-containing protein
MMHAKDLAHTRALIDAISTRDRARAVSIAEEAARALKHALILIDQTSTQWRGPPVPASLLQATQSGQMPVAVVADSTGLYLVSVAPIERDSNWIGAAGVASPLDESAAGALAALTRSDLVIVLAPSGERSVRSASVPAAAGIEAALRRFSSGDSVQRVSVADRPYLLATAELSGAIVGFARDLRRDMSILPRLRRVLIASGAAALVVALVLGSLLALTLLRPVRVLAAAADRLSEGDFGAPLPASPVRELGRVSNAFGTMRTALGLRLDELRAANRMLEERQTRLAALQSELIRRERVAVSGRMAAELAHEIRNPIANLRNCLELLYRRLEEDPPAREFASLAIDELLRMHELAERMLDLHRPHDAALCECDSTKVAGEVATLARMGADDDAICGSRPCRWTRACRDSSRCTQAGSAQPRAERAGSKTTRSAARPSCEYGQLERHHRPDGQWARGAEGDSVRCASNPLICSCSTCGCRVPTAWASSRHCASGVRTSRS